LTPHPDVVFYANCVDFLAHFGLENSSVDYIYPSGTSPYHYFELWFGVGISRLFGLNSALSLVLLVYALGNVIIWTGLCALLSVYKSPRFLDLLVCLLLLFFSGLAFDVYTQVPFMKYIFVFVRNSLSYSKLFPLYIFTLGSILLFMNSQKKAAFLCLLCLPIASITTSIGVLSAVMVWALGVYLWKGNLPYQILGAYLVLAIGLYSYYKFFTPQINTHVTTHFADVVQKMTELGFLKTSFNVFAGATLQFLLLFCPFLFLIRRSEIRKAIQLPELHLLALTYLFSLLGWSLLHDKISSTQIFANVCVVFFNLAASFLLIRRWATWKGGWQLFPVFLVLVLGLGIYTSLKEFRFGYAQSNRYLEKVISNSQKLNPLGAFVFTEEEYNDNEFGSIANFAIRGHYLIYSKNRTFPLSISPHSFTLSHDPKLADIQKGTLENTPFWRYVENQKKEGAFRSIPESQVQFMKDFQLNYLICSKNAVLPKQIQERIESEIVDENTGERFLFLNGF
jgi:hypothetical protein